jgi:probable rRNA maturation factor
MIHVLNRQRRLRLPKEKVNALKTAAEVAVSCLGVSGRAVAIVLVSDQAMRRLNRQFRGLDRPTNVLSFPEDEDDLGAIPAPETDEPELPPLGDVILSVETALREALAAGPSPEPPKAPGHEAGPPEEHTELLFERLLTLVIHGLLHLVGYDHQDDAEEDEMELRALEIHREITAMFHQA